MIDKVEFLGHVNKYFDYLISGYSFGNIGVTVTQYLMFVEFYNKNLDMIVRCEYSFKNDTIVLHICIHASSAKSEVHRSKDSVMLGHLMKKELPDYDYERDLQAYMPSNIGLENSIKKQAQLFSQYADKIISGQDWYSWRDIAGY